MDWGGEGGPPDILTIIVEGSDKARYRPVGYRQSYAPWRWQRVAGPGTDSQGRSCAASTQSTSSSSHWDLGASGLELLSKPPPTLALCWHDDVFPAPPRPFILLPRKFLFLTSSIPSITWPYFLSVDFETVHPSREPASNPSASQQQHPIRRPRNVWRSVSPLPSVNPTFYPSDEPFRCHSEPLHRATARHKQATKTTVLVLALGRMVPSCLL